MDRAYNFFGAHKVPDVLGHERDRAWQRFFFPFLFVPTGLLIGHLFGLTDKAILGGAMSIIPMIYGLVGGLGVLAYLARHPGGNKAIMYLMVVTDPAMAFTAISYEPKVMGWLAVVVLVIIVRTGVRYGMRTMMLSWVSGVIAGFLLLLGTAGHEWRENLIAYMAIGSAMVVGVPLFVPLIKTQARNREIELKKIRVEAMMETLEARSVFLSKVSHELKSPLQSIIATMDLVELRRGLPIDDRLLDKMRRAARGLSTQVVDLLTIAQGESGSLAIKTEITEVGVLFEEVVDSARNSAESKDISLSLHIPDQYPKVMVDGGRLAQILENLLTNAIKYTKVGGVTLRLEDFEGDEVRFVVSDTGIGIEETDIKRIFETYARAGAKTHGMESAGVGLSVVATLLGYMEGSIDVQSTVGVGAKFTVRIPARPESEDTSSMST